VLQFVKRICGFSWECECGRDFSHLFFLLQLFLLSVVIIVAFGSVEGFMGRMRLWLLAVI